MKTESKITENEPLGLMAVIASCKLELKHLAPYLPYGLKMIFESKNGRKISLIGIQIYEVKGKRVGTVISHSGGSMWLEGSGFLPILRPLLDLTKNVDAIGIPIIELAKIWHNDEFWKLEDYHAESSGTEFYFSENCFFTKQDDSIGPVDTLLMFQKLYEWNFDVFGLIEKGLAIDVNTIDNV